MVYNTEALLQDLSTVSGPPRQAEGANDGTFTLTVCALPTQGLQPCANKAFPAPELLNYFSELDECQRLSL